MSGVEIIQVICGRIEFTVTDRSSRYYGKCLDFDMESGYAYEHGCVGDASRRVHYFSPAESLAAFGRSYGRPEVAVEPEPADPVKKDPSDQPPHSGTEPIDAVRRTMSPEEFNGFLKGNVLRHLTRAGTEAQPGQDLHKACWYAMFLYLENGGTVESLSKTFAYMKERFTK